MVGDPIRSKSRISSNEGSKCSSSNLPVIARKNTLLVQRAADSHKDTAYTQQLYRTNNSYLYILIVLIHENYL